jgi:protein-S-isoprenylcysteine O-methyltransferase Ste14
MQPDRADVVVFPPVLPLSSFALGLVLDRLLPLAPVPASLRGDLRAIGACVLVVGIAGFAWMIVTMKRARTPIHNKRTPTALVETGPFRITRNPMYLSGTIGYVGLALVLAEPWPLVLVLPLMVALHHGVVLREEAYLARTFGASYDRYRARVPRWL